MNSEELQLLPIQHGEAPISIAFRYLPPGKGKPVFVWFCGFKSNMESTKAEALSGWARAQEAGCLRFDYSGHGRSGGRFEEGTISGWLEEAGAVCRAQLANGQDAVFVGSSMGGWIAMLLALRCLYGGGGAGFRPPKGIVLIAPAWDMTRFMWEGASEDARTAIVRDGVYYRPSAYSDAPFAITKALLDDGERHLFGRGPVPFDFPIRILHGCRDPDVPWEHSLDLAGIVRSEDVRLTLVKDGEHRLSRPQDLALLFSLLAEFL